MKIPRCKKQIIISNPCNTMFNKHEQQQQQQGWTKCSWPDVSGLQHLAFLISEDAC